MHCYYSVVPGGGSGGSGPEPLPSKSLRSTAPPVPGKTLGPVVPGGLGLGVTALQPALCELGDGLGVGADDVLGVDVEDVPPPLLLEVLEPLLPGGGVGGASVVGDPVGPALPVG